MDKHTDDFSPQESLQIIQAMIDKTKDSVADKSYYFLLWGWLVLIAALTQFVLKVIVRTGLNPVAWNLMFLGIIFSIIHGRKEQSRRRVKSHVDDSLRYLWTGVAVNQVLIVLVFSVRGDWQNCYTFFIMLYSIGCFVTGRILKFPPLVWGAIAGWLLVIVTLFAGYDYNILVLALAILVSYIIPGYLLRSEHKKRLKQTAYGK